MGKFSSTAAVYTIDVDSADRDLASSSGYRGLAVLRVQFTLASLAGPTVAPPCNCKSHLIQSCGLSARRRRSIRRSTLCARVCRLRKPQLRCVRAYCRVDMNDMNVSFVSPRKSKDPRPIHFSFFPAGFLTRN